MLKRLIITITLLGVTWGSYAADNSSKFEEDYFVGLKAFEDGFYDAARLSLSDFLVKDNGSDQSGFARYLLYQVNMAEGDFKSAKTNLNKLDGFKDKRFDTKKMGNDEMFIETKTDCAAAQKLFLTKVNDDWLKILASSNCGVTDDIIAFTVKNDFGKDSLKLLIDKVKSNKKYLMALYSDLPKEKKSADILNFYGHYFVLEKMTPEFWSLYNEFKDADMVSLALNMVWDKADYNKYISIFNTDVKKGYKLDKAAYCRMVESSNKIGSAFDCGVIDGCLGTKNPDFKKTKLACYMKNNDKEGINIFMGSVSADEALALCEYGRYIIGKGLYDAGFIDKFSGCADKASMYEALVGFGDYKSLIKLVGGSKGQVDLAYLAIAAHFNGNFDEAQLILGQITDKQLSDMVKSRIGVAK